MAYVVKRDGPNGNHKKKFLKTTKQKVVFGIVCGLIGLFLLVIWFESSITYSNVGIDSLNALDGAYVGINRSEDSDDVSDETGLNGGGKAGSVGSVGCPDPNN